MLSRFPTAALLAAMALPAQAADVAYELINNSDLTLVYFYTSPVSDPNWSDNLVTRENALTAGDSGTVSLKDGSDECDYDVKFEFEDGSELTDQVNVCDVATYTLSDAE